MNEERREIDAVARLLISGRAPRAHSELPGGEGARVITLCAVGAPAMGVALGAALGMAPELPPRALLRLPSVDAAGVPTLLEDGESDAPALFFVLVPPHDSRALRALAVAASAHLVWAARSKRALRDAETHLTLLADVATSAPVGVLRERVPSPALGGRVRELGVWRPGLTLPRPVLPFIASAIVRPGAGLDFALALLEGSDQTPAAIK